MQIRHVIITTKLPDARDPVGACEIGHFKVENNFVVMCDEEGKPTGKRLALRPGDDPENVATKMLREQWLSRGSEINFNRQLNYPRWGVA
jgi:hypothetical protein